MNNTAQTATTAFNKNFLNVPAEYWGELFLEMSSVNPAIDMANASKSLIYKYYSYIRMHDEVNAKKALSVPRLRKTDSDKLKDLKKNMSYSSNLEDVAITISSKSKTPLQELLLVEDEVQKILNHPRFDSLFDKGIRIHVRRIQLRKICEEVIGKLPNKMIEQIKNANFKRSTI